MPTFPLAEFRILYPQFNGVDDTVVLLVADNALCYFSARCSAKCVNQQWLLVVAHMLQLQAQAAGGGGASGVLTSATIDKVSVSFAAPPAGSSSTKHWFNLTPFGQQFLVVNKRCNGTVKFIGGRLPRHGARC